jgi:hypothetical protein
MATDCYKLFKNTYKQAIADGLSTSASEQAAKAAMEGCLSAQNTRPHTTVQPIGVIQGTTRDPGPKRPPK